MIPSGLRPIRLHKGTGVITIEEHAATWPSIQRGVRAAGLEVEARVESFSAIARMAIDDLGTAWFHKAWRMPSVFAPIRCRSLPGGRLSVSSGARA